MSTQQITMRARVVNQQWRRDEETGFLRCLVAVLRVDVLKYLPEEMPGAPEVGGDGYVWIYVPPEELGNPDSMKSLEGMPAVVGHIWQTVDTCSVGCGNVSGTPEYRQDAETLFCELLVTDSETVRRIMLPVGDPDKLEEISSAYDANVEWLPGIDGSGNPFHGVFRQIKYNHLAILPSGAGRAGSSVRILNRKGEQMPQIEVVSLRLRSTGRTIRVANEDVAAVEEADTKATNAVDPAKLQETMDQLAEVNAQLSDLQAKKSELEGQLTGLQEQLQAALNPDTVEAAANTLNEERDDADKVMNAHGLKLTPEQRKLRGHALRLEVVNAVRVKNNAPAIDPKADEPFVKGMYSTLREFPMTAAPVVPPAGHQIVVQNATPQGGQGNRPDLTTNEGRRAAMYGGATGTK